MERKRRSVLQSASADGDWMRRPPGHINYGSGEGGGDGKGRRRGGEKQCSAHGDRAAVGVDVDGQGSGFREDETHFLP